MLLSLPELIHSQNLEITWTSKLDEIGYEVISFLTQTFEGYYVSKEYGDFTWETLLDNDEDYLSDNLDIHYTGIFRQLFFNMHRLITSTLEHTRTKNLKNSYLSRMCATIN